jgi:hypothetical protein
MSELFHEHPYLQSRLPPDEHHIVVDRYDVGAVREIIRNLRIALAKELYYTLNSPSGYQKWEQCESQEYWLKLADERAENVKKGIR